MQLFIAEKPMLAKAIAAAMPGAQTFDDKLGVYRKTFEGEEVVIFACRGHILTLAKPEEYDEKYKVWKIEDLPIFFHNWKKSIPDDADKKRLVGNFTKLCKDADSIVIAGDMDDEGQLLCDELVDWVNYKGPAYRLDTRDTAPGALFKALHHMENNKDHVKNGRAAAGREISDMVFGFNLTRYYTILNQSRSVLSVGRVQTPTLGLVVRRDMLINSHQKVFYFTLDADLSIDGKTVTARYVPAKDDKSLEDGKILDKNYLEKIASQINGKSFPNTVVEHKTGKENPPLPFNLSKLTLYCASKWDYSPEKVMEITQKLRDNHNAITYNRSDCQYLTEEYYKQAPETVPQIAKNLGLDGSMFDPKIHSRCFNDEEVAKGSHFAIIPTNVEQDISKFTTPEKNVYQAIARYYLAQFLPPATKEKTKLTIQLQEGGTLEATSTVVVSPGYRAIIRPESDVVSGENDEGSDEVQSELSSIKDGKYTSTCKGTNIAERETKPPSHYTAGTLIDDMTRISKYCENETIKKLLLQKDNGKKGENGSIGTSATRATVVKTLIDRGYIEEFKKGKLTYIRCTELGFEFYNMLPDSIRKVDVTAKWYLIQEDIRAGKTTPEAMAENVLKSVNAIIQSGEGRMANAERLSSGMTGSPIGKCPKCGKDVYLAKNRYKCEACDFVVWADNALFKAIGKELKPNVMTALLKNGKVSLTGCVSQKTGKKFDAVIKADFSGDKVNFEFVNGPANDKAIASCPKCHTGVVQEYPSSYKCNNTACGFTLYKTDKFLDAMGKKLTTANAKELLTSGRTLLKNVKSKKTGKTYDCILCGDFSEKYPKWKTEFPSGNNSAGAKKAKA